MPAWNKGWIAGEPSSSVTSAQALVVASLKGVTATAAEISLLDGVTATAAEITNKCDGDNSYVSTGTTASYTVLAANTGKLHTMGNIGAHQTITLPTAAAGLNYKFIFNGDADEAQNFIIDSGTNDACFIGGVQHEDTSDTMAPVYSDGNSNSIFTMVVPGAGTEIDILCDGTDWYIWGRVVGNTVPTFADQS
jgi:hypothetical protein